MERGRCGAWRADFFRNFLVNGLNFSAHPQRSTGRLGAIVAEAAVYGAAHMVLRAGSPPDVQERAHFHGRAAT